MKLPTRIVTLAFAAGIVCSSPLLAQTQAGSQAEAATGDLTGVWYPSSVNTFNFIWTDPRPDTTAKPCMSKCADPADVKIMSTAEGNGLTPRTTGPLDTMQPK